MKRTIMCLLICVGLAGCRPAVPNKPEPTTPPMRYPEAIFFVTYTGPVKTAFTSSVTQSWSQAEGQPIRYRSTMMQCQHNGEPPSPGRVQWEFAGTVMECDVYVVRIHPDMTATNATILPVIYSGTPLNVFNDGTLVIRLATTGLATMARTDDPVLSVNTNRILSVSKGGTSGQIRVESKRE